MEAMGFDKNMRYYFITLYPSLAGIVKQAPNKGFGLFLTSAIFNL
jgi:hypothetical protein